MRRDPSDLEPATNDSFAPDRYLAANPDVARHVAAGGDAWNHFDRHGRREGRQQLTAAAMGLPGSDRARKYARFADALDPARGAGGDFRFVAEQGAFPIAYGGAPYDIGAYERESANPGLGLFQQAVLANPDLRFADIGCGRRARHLPNCLYVEVYPSLSADIVMQPACRYPIADGSLDGIGCFAVMEHMARPWEAAAEFRRMLKPGGRVWIDYPFLVPVHGYPSHYFNATREGMLSLFADGFAAEHVETHAAQTPDFALAWQMRAMRDALTDPALRAELEGMTMGDLLAQEPGGPFWRRVTAALPDDAVQRLAAGNTLVARKL